MIGTDSLFLRALTGFSEWRHSDGDTVRRIVSLKDDQVGRFLAPMSARRNWGCIISPCRVQYTLGNGDFSIHSVETGSPGGNQMNIKDPSCRIPVGGGIPDRSGSSAVCLPLCVRQPLLPLMLSIPLVMFSVQAFAVEIAIPPQWAPLDTVGSPSPRWGHKMAYDASRDRVVLFGGDTGRVSGETWLLNGTTWTLAQNYGPSARTHQAMAYDSTRNRVVMFGGTTGGDETWEWIGFGWRRFGTRGPTARAFHAMAYDSDRDRMVLFGGLNVSTPLGDTWELEGGTTWTLKSTTGPVPRYAHAMAYDAVRHRVVLFGGWDGSDYKDDTWEWDGSQWLEITSVRRPSARLGHAMVFDPTRQTIFLFGGEGDSGRQRDTWEWDGVTWGWRYGIGPSARLYHSMAYDTARDRTVLFGGTAGQAQLFGDTWTLSILFPNVEPGQIADAILGRTPSDNSYDLNRDQAVDVADIILSLTP